MKNLHVLPTDKPSRLYSYKSNLFLTTKSHLNVPSIKYQNIYITSDEEIKEGDWFIRDGSIHKCFRVHKTDIEFLTSIDSVYCGSNTFWSKGFCKKIILTTDQDLDGIQAIDDEFLEWFVKNPNCEEVEVEEEDYSQKCRECGETVKRGYICKKGCFMESGNFIPTDKNIKYKIIIPKEEPKQEFCDNCNNDVCCCIIRTQTKLEEFIFKVPFDYNIKPKEVIDMCIKEQENIILTWRLGYFIDMINSLPDDTEKNRILKSVFDNRDGELLLESYKLMKSHYEK